ncbi:MAG: AAA family ATPase [Aerococcus urinaeequi]
MTTVVLKSLEAKNFKNHQSLHITFPINEDIEITGPNGGGKTTVGEILTWTTHGVDLMGNAMTKKLSPEPTTYEWDRLTTNALLGVDGVDVMLGKKVENGKTTYYVNDIEKTATDYKAFIAQLFDQKEFLSIFSPAFFFSQTYQEQRALVSKYVTTAAEKEVLAQLPKHQATPLKAALKKGSLEEVEKTYKGKRKDADVELIRSKQHLKTLLEMNEHGQINFTVEDIEKDIAEVDQMVKEAQVIRDRNKTLYTKRSQLEAEIRKVFDRKEALKNRHAMIKGEHIEENCPTCKQDLPEEAKKAAEASKASDLKRIADEHNPLLEQLKLMKEELRGMPEPEPDQMELMGRRAELVSKRNIAAEVSGLADKIKKAEEAVNVADKEYKAAETILDGVTSYKAVAGELNVAKMDGMFPGLTINHFTENIGNGEKKPDFEFCMDGKPYRKLSYGEKIKAGILFVRGLIVASNLKMPVFVDNAESLTSEFDLPTQVIACYAKKTQKEGIEFRKAKDESMEVVK